MPIKIFVCIFFFLNIFFDIVNTKNNATVLVAGYI